MSAQKPDAGFLTSDGWRERWSCKRTSARGYIATAVSKGIMEERSFRVLCSGRLQKVKHFGLKIKLSPRPKGG